MLLMELLLPPIMGIQHSFMRKGKGMERMVTHLEWMMSLLFGHPNSPVMDEIRYVGKINGPITSLKCSLGRKTREKNCMGQWTSRVLV